MVCDSAVDGNIETQVGVPVLVPPRISSFVRRQIQSKKQTSLYIIFISRMRFAQSGDFVLHRPLRTKWQMRNRLDSGSLGGARGSVTRGDSTAYGGPCRPMLPPLGLVEPMPIVDWLGRAVYGSWSALLAP